MFFVFRRDQFSNFVISTEYGADLDHTGLRGDGGVRADPGPERLHERPALVAGADRDGPDRRDGQGQPEDQDQDHGVQRLRAVPQVHRRQRSHRGQNYQGFADFKIVGVTFF